MLRLAVVAGGPVGTIPAGFDAYIGVDAGCLALLAAGHSLALAVGDFDSVTPADLARIQSQAGECLQASPEKDDTDLTLAVLAALTRWPQAQVTIYGALGGRLDHTLSNVFLATEPNLTPYMRQLTLVDDHNLITTYPAGQHRIPALAGYTYVAFMPADETRLTISGAKYDLDAAHFFFKKCYTSNEFIKDDLTISLDQGYVVVIYSKDETC